MPKNLLNILCEFHCHVLELNCEECTVSHAGDQNPRNVKIDNGEDGHSDAEMCRRPRARCHIHKGYDCCRRQTDMARRYPDDDPLRHLRSHSVALTVGLSVQRHHQHEIPAGTKAAGAHVTNERFERFEESHAFT